MFEHAQDCHGDDCSRMDDENVRPTFKPRYTLEAVKITVIRAPRIIPRAVNSGILG